jgi:hypothetical protein
MSFNIDGALMTLSEAGSTAGRRIRLPGFYEFDSTFAIQVIIYVLTH